MKILIIAYTDLKMDPRPYRQINCLNKLYSVYTVGKSNSGLEKSFFPIKKHGFIINMIRIFILKMGFNKWYYWDKYKKNLLKLIDKNNFDLVIAHEIKTLPLALRIAKGSPVILDAHEYSPNNFDDDFLWRFFLKKHFIWLCKSYLPKIDKLVSVSPGIVDKYRSEFNTKSILLTNAANYFKSLKPKIVSETKIKIIYHGLLSKSRRIDLFIEMMRYLDNDIYELTLMLVYGTYEKLLYKKLKKKAKGLNIKFEKPVKRKNLIKFSNKFDLGLCFFQPINFNLKYALPNKFFELIQSRVAVVIGPDIEMSKYVKKYKIGIISKDWSAKSLANIIANTNKEQIMFHKVQCHKNAMKLSSINNNKFFIKTIESYDKN